MNKADLIVKAMAILFLIKPSVDLLWHQIIFTVGSRPVTLLHIFAIFALVYFTKFLFAYPRKTAPYSGLFKLFILSNFISVAYTSMSSPVSAIEIINLVMRIVISYVMYNAAYLAGYYGQVDEKVRLVRAISVGTLIALLFNLAAISLGYGGMKMGSNQSLRATGLYHDSGTLGNVALYNIIFTAFVIHIMPRKHVGWLLYSAGSILVSLYLIYIGLSRVVFVEFFVFGAIYVFMFKRGAARLVPIGFFIVALGVGTMAGLDYSKYSQRFESELQVLDQSVDIQTKQDKDVDLGRFERVGSNRGQLVAYALDRFIKREPADMVLGDFHTRSSHSDYIDVLGRNGILGLLIYLIFLFMVTRYAWKVARKMGVKAPSSIHVLAFSLIFLYVLYSFPFRPLLLTTMAWIMWAAIGYAFGLADRPREPKLDEKVAQDVDQSNPRVLHRAAAAKPTALYSRSEP